MMPRTPSFTAFPAPSWLTQGLPLALLAVLAPALLAVSDPPSITFYNQAAGALGWGLWMAWWAAQPAPPAQHAHSQSAHSGPLMAISAVLWLTAGSAIGSAWATGLPWGLGLMAASLALSGWWVMFSAWQAAHRFSAAEVMDLFALALSITGAICLAMGAMQVFAPDWVDGTFIAEPAAAGRAVGNLRQPNHFSTLLIWTLCGAVWLGRRGRWHVNAALAMLLIGVGGVVWSASRTGMLAMLLFTLWGWRDARLPRRLRWALVAAPLIYGAWWLGMDWWAQWGSGHAFAGKARLSDGSDISSSRFKIWANTWQLIQVHPWTGVGWGEFNLAWTLTPFPQRPIAFFDHTHNLLMQWAVELGLPMAVLLSGLCSWGLLALWLPWGAGAQSAPAGTNTPDTARDDAHGVVAMAAAVLSLAALHSLLEYPLWYSYFLLPASFAFGLALAARAQLDLQQAGQAPQRMPRHQVVPGLLMALGALWCAIDYQWAANIYAPRPGSGSLAQRIEAGQQRLWFGYQADYAHATAPDEDEPSLPPQAFKRTVHNLLDARLMIAYARSLAEHGEIDKARYVVQRLKEFRHPMGKAFLAPCDNLAKGQDRPFQCDPPALAYTWRQVLPR